MWFHQMRSIESRGPVQTEGPNNLDSLRKPLTPPPPPPPYVERSE